TAFSVSLKHFARALWSAAANARADATTIAWHATASLLNRGGASGGVNALPRATGPAPTVIRVSPFASLASTSTSCSVTGSMTETECSPRFRTYTRWPSGRTDTSSALSPTGTSTTTVWLAVSMTESVSGPLLTTYASVPSGLNATPSGYAPTA